MTDKKMIVNLDFRTLLFLDVLIMLFMLLSGKAEVTLIAFVIAGTALMVFGLYATVIRCTIVFAVLFLYNYTFKWLHLSRLPSFRYWNHRFHYPEDHSVSHAGNRNKRAKEYL